MNMLSGLRQNRVSRCKLYPFPFCFSTSVFPVCSEMLISSLPFLFQSWGCIKNCFPVYWFVWKYRICRYWFLQYSTIDFFLANNASFAYDRHFSHGVGVYCEVKSQNGSIRLFLMAFWCSLSLAAPCSKLFPKRYAIVGFI